MSPANTRSLTSVRVYTLHSCSSPYWSTSSSALCFCVSMFLCLGLKIKALKRQVPHLLSGADNRELAYFNLSLVVYQDGGALVIGSSRSIYVQSTFNCTPHMRPLLSISCTVLSSTRFWLT